MAKKKNTQISVSQEDNAQAQHILELYHQIANDLHASADQKQAEAALTEINNMPEGAQFALLKALSKELNTDAADVLTAIYELSPIKSVRKEARRSLIRLEGVRVYPEWRPPLEPTLVMQVTNTPVNRPVLEAPYLDEDVDFDEETEDSINIHDLKPDGVVVNFVESWVNGEYDIAYDLLSSDSPLREGLSKDEWIDRRDAWADEADPRDLEPGFIHEREPQELGLWLPNTVSASRSTTRKEIEAGWSIELDETDSSDTLPELPQATIIYEETGRHWFWTSYILIQEEDEWRIQSMTDEGANAQGLSIAELHRRIQEHDKYLDELAQKQKQKPADTAEAEQYLETIFWRVMHTLYYYDALIKQLSFDRSVYQEAAARTLIFRQYERCIVYLELLIERFPEQRATNLRSLAAVQGDLSQKYFDKGDEERARRCQERAEEALRESLTIEDSFDTHISLAEVLIDMDERLDEAEEHLLQAKAMVTDPAEVAHIELHLGEIAMGREQYEEALSHYQRVVEHDPSSPDAWFDVAEAHKMLKNFEEAEASYRRAISLRPDDEDIYFALSKMFVENNQLSKAIEVIEEGLSANPDSVVLNIYLATTYLERGDYRQAQIFLERAERIDPESEVVLMFRNVLRLIELEQGPRINKLNRPKPKKKRR